MNKLHKIYIIFIISLTLIFSIIVVILNFNNNKIIKDNNNYKYINDSLELQNIKIQYLIDSKYTKLDSLFKTSNNTKNYYETNIQNLSNTNIVSDDSITSYIRKQIYSK